MGWWLEFLKVLLKTLGMILLSFVMRIRYWIDPSAREKDIKKMRESGKFELNDENRKYWVADNPENLEDFMWTWKQISVAFKAMVQDINKTAEIYKDAPNPKLHDPAAGDTKHLLSMATKSGEISNIVLTLETNDI